MQPTSEIAREVAPGKPYRFTVDQYLRLGEIGLLDSALRTELVAGEIVVVAPVNALHVVTKNTLRRAIERALAGSPAWEVIDQDPLRIGDADVPQPDIAVVRPMTPAALASAADALLVIDVSDSTLIDDLGRKRRLYAGAGIPHFWVADVNRRVLHRFAEPAGGDYQVHDELSTDMLVAIPGTAGESGPLSVATLLPWLPSARS